MCIVNNKWVVSTLKEAIHEFEQVRLAWLEGEYCPLNVKMVAELDEKIKAHQEALEVVGGEVVNILDRNADRTTRGDSSEIELSEY